MKNALAALLVVPQRRLAHRLNGECSGEPDPRWTPWLGCWTVSVDTTRGGDAVFAEQQAPRARVCVVARGNAATLTTDVSDKPALMQTIVADGSPQPLDEGGCTGTQRVEWSSDGSRRTRAPS